MKIRLATVCVCLLFMHLLFARYYPLIHAIPLLFLCGGLYYLSRCRISIPPFSSRIIAIFIIVVAIGLISAIMNIGRIITYPFQGTIKYLSYVLFFLLVYKSSLSNRRFYRIIACVVILSSIVFIIQKFALGSYRPYSLFAHSNHYAYFLAFAFIIIASHMRNLLRINIVFLLMGTLILATKSLGGLIVVIFGYTMFARKNARNGTVVLAVFLSVFLFIAITVQKERIKELADLNSITERIDEQNPGGGSSFRWRIVYWYIIVSNIIENGNIVFGNGTGATSSGSPIAFDVIRKDPHNDYVRIFGETGLIGLSLYFIMYLLIGFLFLKYKKMYMPMWTADNCRQFNALVTLLISFMLAQVSGNVIVSSAVVWMLCAYAAITLRDSKPQVISTTQ